MHDSQGYLRISSLPAVLMVIGLGLIGGCTIDLFGFRSGTYTGSPACVLDVTDPTGATGQEPFTEDLTVDIDRSDAFTINGVPVEIGAMHVRSLPNAELAFEIVAIRQSARELQVTYEPRPTLPGIEMSGQLIETYRWDKDHITASAAAELAVSSTDGVANFSVTCNGNLLSSASTP